MKEFKSTPEAVKLSEIPISYEEKGKKIGKEIGKEIGKREVAVEMLKEGTEVDFIAKVTGLELNEIEQLKKEL